MTFKNPFILIALLPLAAMIAVYARRKGPGATIRFSSSGLFTGLKSSFKLELSRNIVFLRLACVVLMIIALARPQAPVADSKIETEGIDICLAIDCSTSMLAEDFKIVGGRQNRIEVVKETVRDFIRGRKNDRIGIVAFAARAYTICPLTLDYGWLSENLERIKAGMIEDGTAIGSGIASSLNRLKDTRAKSKIIILLTDGRNNTGNISPMTAAQAAKALKVKIYTIGAGGKGPVPYPVKDFFGNTVYQSILVDIDEETLMKIASETGAKYFRATDTESLKKIYKEIDTLEKTPLEEKGYMEYRELFPVFLMPGLMLLFLEIALTGTLLRKIP